MITSRGAMDDSTMGDVLARISRSEQDVLVVGIIDHLTRSLMCFCLDVCGTTPWVSYVGSDDQTWSDS